MQRREFISGMLATVVMVSSYLGIAKPVASSLGARSTAIVENGGEAGIPYVTDGLVAMWDGIWNVGIGEHDEDSSTWKDLASGLDTVLPSVAYVPDSCIGFTGNSDVTYNVSQETLDVLMSADVTIEACLYICPAPGAPYRIIFVTSGWEIYIYTPRTASSSQKYIFYNYYGRASSVDSILDADGTFLGTMTLTCSTDAMMGTRYKNGLYSTKATFSSIPQSEITSLTSRFWSGVRVYSIRIYNRPLSAEEVSYNYAIDKERFGMP